MREFWEHELGASWTRVNPHLDRFTDAKTTTALPLGFHGDDAQYVKHGSILILSINGVLCRTSHNRSPWKHQGWFQAVVEVLMRIQFSGIR